MPRRLRHQLGDLVLVAFALLVREGQGCRVRADPELGTIDQLPGRSSPARQRQAEAATRSTTARIPIFARSEITVASPSPTASRDDRDPRHHRHAPSDRRRCRRCSSPRPGPRRTAGMTFCWLEVTFCRPLMTVSVNCSYVMVFERVGKHRAVRAAGPVWTMAAHAGVGVSTPAVERALVDLAVYHRVRLLVLCRCRRAA